MSALPASLGPSAQETRRAGGGGWSIAAFLRLLWIELKRSQGYWLLPPIVAVGLYAPTVNWKPDLVFWREMNIAATQGYFMAGSLAAVLVAWMKDRDRRRRTGDLLETIRGFGFTGDFAISAAALAWGLAGYLLIVGWYWGQGFLRATWGGPDVGMVLLGALGVVVSVLVGLLVATVARGRFTPIIAFMLTGGLTIGSFGYATHRADGSAQPPFKFLMPWGITDTDQSSVFVERIESWMPESIVWMIAFSLVLLASIVSIRLRERQAVLAMGLAIVLAVVAARPLVPADVNWQPEAFRPVAFTPICAQSEVVEVCVHPAYEPLLDKTLGQMSGMLEPIQDLEGVPKMWQQSSDAMWTSDRLAGELPLDLEYDVTLQQAVWSLVPLLPQYEFGLIRPGSQLVIMRWLLQQGDIVYPWPISSGPMGWAAELEIEAENGLIGPAIDKASHELDLEMQAALERFSALTPEEQRAWLEANWTALRAGDLTLDDLP